MDGLSPTSSPLVELPACSESSPTHHEGTEQDISIINTPKSELPPHFGDNIPLYRPHGKWAWTKDHDILSYDPGSRLGSGLEGIVNLKVGQINNKHVIYISKLASVWDNWKLLFSTLYLNAATQYLRPLQGDCIPWIIAVRHCLGGRVAIAQDLPHPTGWREADMFLDEAQKEVIIAAYQKLHDRGILHGDVEYRHMLIGDDGKATLIDFGFSRVIQPSEQARKAGVDSCSPLSLREEMRKVKFMLDWKDSRTTEYRLARLRNARETKDRAALEASLEKKTHIFEQIDVLKEPVSEEELAVADGALRLCDLDDWSYGKTWTAHRYEVIRSNTKAEFRKTDVPRPHILPVATAEEPVSFSIPKEPALMIASSAVRTPTSTGTKPNISPQVGQCTGKRFRDRGQDHIEREAIDVPRWPRRARDETDERAKKRRRTSESGLDPSSDMCSDMQSPTPHVRPSASLLPLEPPEVEDDEDQDDDTNDILQEDGEIFSDPTPYELDAEAWAHLRSGATGCWARFTNANMRVQRLQSSLDEEKHKLEKHRSDFIRMMLMLPAEDRTTIWTNTGQPDVRHILGLLPESNNLEPVRNSTTARTQLAQDRPAPRTVRGAHPQSVKTHPRLAAIRRSESSSRPPSKLRQCISVASPSQPSSGSLKAARREIPGRGTNPKAERVKDQWAKYSEVLSKRAELEVARDNVAPPLTPPSLTMGSSSKASPPTSPNAPRNDHEESVASDSNPTLTRIHAIHMKVWADRLKSPLDRETDLSPTASRAFASPRIVSRPLGHSTEMSKTAVCSTSDISAPFAGSVNTPKPVAKRKLDAMDEVLSGVDGERPITKRQKGESCGLM